MSCSRSHFLVPILLWNKKGINHKYISKMLRLKISNWIYSFFLDLFVGNRAVSVFYEDENKACLRLQKKKTPPWDIHSLICTREVYIKAGRAGTLIRVCVQHVWPGHRLHWPFWIFTFHLVSAILIFFLNMNTNQLFFKVKDTLCWS